MKDYTITYSVTADLDCFQFWGGAKDRVDDATDEQREQMFERIVDWCECVDETTETTINDIVWFDCDDIFYPNEVYTEQVV